MQKFCREEIRQPQLFKTPRGSVQLQNLVPSRCNFVIYANQETLCDSLYQNYRLCFCGGQHPYSIDLSRKASQTEKLILVDAWNNEDMTPSPPWKS